jgi:uncharacterized protein
VRIAKIEEQQRAFCHQHWFLKPAQEGHGEACLKVAYYYENGVGTDRDLKSAKKWYQRAVKHGEKDAVAALLRLGKPPEIAA